MNAIQAAESNLLQLRGRLAARRQDLSIAEKAGRPTEEIAKQVAEAERLVRQAESHLARLGKSKS